MTSKLESLKMKTKFLIGLLVFGIVLISGCTEKECKINDDCLAKTCFTGKCKENKCVLSSVSDCCGNEKCEVGEIYPECVTDCPDCDDINDCTDDSYDYHEQECVNKAILDKVCCGNGLCEIGETYESCTRDCPDCNDDNECTKDSYDYHKQECVNEVIIPCCGNEICDEDAETYSNCQTDCPKCDDDDNLTADSFNYKTQECENTELLIKKDLGDYKYVESMYGGDAAEVELYSEEGEQIGIIKCGLAVYKNSADQGQMAIVCPYDNRQDVTNSLEGMSIDMGFVSEEYKGEKVYLVDKEIIVWTNNAYILASGTEPGSSGVPPAEVIIDAYLKKYPNDLG